MKKISIFMASLVAVLMFNSCKEDTEPRLEIDPSTIEFTVNTPPMANQYIDLSENGTVDFSCSQPDYGFAAITTYVVQVSLSPEFKHNAKYKHVINGEEEAEYMPQPGDFVELRDPGNQANMQIKDLYITRAINKLLTWTNDEGEPQKITSAEEMALALAQNYPAEDGYEGYIPLYVRIRAYIAQDEEMSSVVSQNSVCFRHIKPFFSLEVPSKIYMTGEFTGWPAPTEGAIAPDDDPQKAGCIWVLSELDDEIDSKVFRASFYLHNKNDKNEFRFYQEPLHGWGSAGSLGGAEDDFSAVALELDGGVAHGSVVQDGQGNWQLREKGNKDIESGWYDFVVDLNEMSIEVRHVSQPTYIPESKLPLYDKYK